MARIKEFFTSRIHIDPDKADKWMKTGGVLLGILALFTLISVVSYFFTWKTDQSLLLDHMEDIPSILRHRELFHFRIII